MSSNTNDSCQTNPQSTCAIHSVVIDSLKQNIERLGEGQQEMKIIIQNNHSETLENIRYIASEHKKSLERVHDRVDKEVVGLRTQIAMLEKELAKVNVKMAWLVGAASAISAIASQAVRFLF